MVYIFNEREVKIIYAFYIDVFYLRTFMVNSMGMICITYVLKIPLYGRIRRIILAGAASGMVSCLLLLFGGYSIYRWLSLFVVAPAAVYFATDARIGMIKLFGLSVFVTVLSGGVVYALDSLLSADTSLICTGGFVITYMILKSWCECSNDSRGLYRVTIMEKEKRVYVTALYDSGNLLKKQPENVPVHIAKASVFDITGDDKEYINVPYKSLGNENGCLKACYFDTMVVENKGKKKLLHNVLIGKASENLLTNSAYDMILNEAVFSDSKEIKKSYFWKKQNK